MEEKNTNRYDSNTPASKLNNMMSKHKIIPIYELVHSDTNRVVGNFVFRVTCPISPGGRPLSAESSHCRSKKEAKHDAALRFMETFLNYGNNDRRSTSEQRDKKSSLKADVIYAAGHDVLKNICLKDNLGRPKIEDICAVGPPHAPTFTAECKVSHLCIQGEGKSKVEARLHATARMIQILMETASIHEILKPPQFATSGMQPFTWKSSNSGKTAGSNTGLQEIHEPLQNCASVLNRKRKLDTGSSQLEAGEEPITHNKPDAAKTLIGLLNARKKLADKIQQLSRSDSTNNENVIDLTQDLPGCQTFDIKPRNALINDNNNCVINCASGGDEGTLNTTEIHKNLTRLQAVSQIDRTLGNMERELFDKILNALVYSNLSYGQSVAILSRNYEIFIHQNSPPIIFEGNNECTDQSIRVACLTKLLLDLKKHIEINHLKVVK